MRAKRPSPSLSRHIQTARHGPGQAAERSQVAIALACLCAAPIQIIMAVLAATGMAFARNIAREFGAFFLPVAEAPRLTIEQFAR